MCIICNENLKVGEELKVKFELEPELPFEATIKVRFFDDGCFGAEIIEADPQSGSNLKQFLQSKYPGQSGLTERRSRS